MAASSSTAPGSSPYRSRFGDTTQTKVFVGGLAWETPSEGLRQHFEPYGDILEAVVITDRLTGRSKGYGFVTFREAEAARRAVQEPNPMITGRRANCNIASLGPPRPAPQQQQPPRGMASSHVQGPPQPQMGLLPQPHGAAAAIYNHHPSQFGYWYPPDYQYQQAMMSPQVLQSYYAQLYAGLASPTGPPPYHHHQQYVGYMPTPTPPRPVLSPAQQLAAPPYVPLRSTAVARMQASFVHVPSLPHTLPHNFAMSMLPPTPADHLQSAAGQQAYSAASATSTNNTHHHQGA
ncbi:unnamed protein product [Alopecurus aequalis]